MSTNSQPLSIPSNTYSTSFPILDFFLLFLRADRARARTLGASLGSFIICVTDIAKSILNLH